MNSVNDLSRQKKEKKVNKILDYALTVTTVVLSVIYLGLMNTDAYATVSMFIKIGDVQGPSSDSEHKSWIDVMSYSLDITNSDGKIKFGNLEIIHNLDSSTPQLYEVLLSQKNIGTATLQLCRTGTAFQQCYMEYKIEDAKIKELSAYRTNTKDIQKEKIGLQYGKITFTYYNFVGQSGKIQEKASFCWDAKLNRSCDS